MKMQDATAEVSLTPGQTIHECHAFYEAGEPRHFLIKEGRKGRSPEHLLLDHLESVICSGNSDHKRFLIIDYNRNMILMTNGNRVKVLVRRKTNRVSLRRKGTPNIIVEGNANLIWNEIDHWASMPPVEEKKSVRSSRNDDHAKRLLESCGITL